MNHEITLEVAEKMIHAAKSKAEELKILGRYRGCGRERKSQGVRLYGWGLAWQY
jgi:hypothetical protein